MSERPAGKASSVSGAAAVRRDLQSLWGYAAPRDIREELRKLAEAMDGENIPAPAGFFVRNQREMVGMLVSLKLGPLAFTGETEPTGVSAEALEAKERFEKATAHLTWPLEGEVECCGLKWRQLV